MGGWLIGSLMLAMASLPVIRSGDESIDLSKPVSDPVGYFQGSRSDFLSDHVSRFNKENGTQVSVVFVDSLGDFQKASEFSRSLLEADGSKAYGEDKRVLILFCIKPQVPTPARLITPDAKVHLYAHLQVGDDLENILPPEARSAIIRQMRNDSKDHGVMVATRNALAEVFTRINPEYKTDIATVATLAVKMSKQDKTWKFVRRLPRLFLIMALTWFLCDLVAKIYDRVRYRRLMLKTGAKQANS